MFSDAHFMCPNLKSSKFNLSNKVIGSVNLKVYRTIILLYALLFEVYSSFKKKIRTKEPIRAA